MTDNVNLAELDPVYFIHRLLGTMIRQYAGTIPDDDLVNCTAAAYLTAVEEDGVQLIPDGYSVADVIAYLLELQAMVWKAGGYEEALRRWQEGYPGVSSLEELKATGAVDDLDLDMGYSPTVAGFLSSVNNQPTNSGE